MTTIGYELIKELAVRNAGRSPVAFPQEYIFASDIGNQDPPNKTDGVSTAGAIKALVGVRLNEQPGTISGLLRIDAPSDANPYGIEFFGSAGTTISGASASTVAVCAANVLASFASSFSIGSAEMFNGSDDVIKWTISIDHPDRVPPYRPVDDFVGAGTLVDSIISNASGLAGNQSSVVEASRATFRVWGLPVGQDEFVVRRDIPEMVAVGGETSIEVCVAGYTRTFVEVISADGYCIGVVAPAVLEADAPSTIDAANAAWESVTDTLSLFDVVEQGRQLPASRETIITADSTAPEVISQEMVTVATTATVLMLANPNRHGFLLRNNGTSDVWMRWRPSRSTANYAPAKDDGYKLAAGEIRTGVNVPGNELVAIADGSSSDVWREEW